MDSDYRILRAPDALHYRTGLRHVLVEALALSGAALLRRAYVPPPCAAAGDVVELSPEETVALEQAFVAAEAGDYLAARHANGAPRDAARPNAPSMRWAGMRGRARRSA